MIVGSGPNGLSAAVRLAQAGVGVTVIEAKETLGGGTRTQELTLPGFQHDVCSAIHPLGAASPFFRSLPLEQHGLHWIEPEIAVAHPFDDGSALALVRSINETAGSLGSDGPAYRRLFEPLAEGWHDLAPAILGPILRLPRHPWLLSRFGLNAVRSATGLADSVFSRPQTRALFAGLAAHANARLDRPLTASAGLVMGAAGHVVGWPLAAGGSAHITGALASLLRSLGGETVTGRRVGSLADLPDADAVLFDLTPRQMVAIAGSELSDGYQRSVRNFRHGPAVFKLDYALDGPIPWTASECQRAGTVHLGASIEEISQSEAAIAEGRTPGRPFVILAQQSLFDPSRAPGGKHTAWAYCHLPRGSEEDMQDRIEAQIERFAPGFRDLILARHVMGPAALEQYNENYFGGDIAAGASDGLQLLLRPNRRLSPYTTSSRRLFICSASTPPGGGVHGMCGFNAAMTALQRLP